MKNLAIQKSINTLDKLRTQLSQAEDHCYDADVVDKLEARVDKAYDSVAEVAKRQGLCKLTGEEFDSNTEIDVDTINDIIKYL